MDSHKTKEDTLGEDFHYACAADFLTTSDLAFTTWQYINSAQDWKAKKECEDALLHFSCNTHWTSGECV